MVKILSVLLVLLLATPVFSQSAVKATDYWVTFLPSIDNSAPTYLLASTSMPGTQVRVTYTDDGSYEEFIVGPGTPKEYRMKSKTVSGFTYMLAKPDQPHVVQRRSAHVTSNYPIALQQFTDGDNNVSMSLPIPTSYLGRKYMISSFNDQHSRMSESGGGGGWEPAAFPKTSGEFIVVAVEDGTKVTILASSKFANGLQLGQSETITLNKGQTYLAKGAAESEDDDISNTLVTADKPIVVTAGCEIARTLDAMVLQNHYDFNDYIAEYMPPVEQWGTEYVGVPMTNKRGTKEDDLWGDFYRIYATEETELFMDGQTRGSAKYWEFSLQTVPRLFTASKPIMVVQYDYYIDFHGINPKTPRTSNNMQVLLPRHHWVKRASGTLPSGYGSTFFYVTAHRDSIDQITVKRGETGVASPIGGMKFSGAQTYNIGPYRMYTIILSAKGDYTFEGPCQFQVLNHGTRDNDQIKVTYSYGSIVGSTFGRVGSISASPLKVAIDSSCGQFDITVTDTAANGEGVGEIFLSYDGALGIANARLEIDPYTYGAKSLTGRLLPVDPFKEMTASITIRSKAGVETTVSSRMEGVPLVLSTLSDFGKVRYGDTTCQTLLIMNTGNSPLTITDLVWTKGNAGFGISDMPSTPRVLAPAQTMSFNVCHVSQDLTKDLDTLRLVTGCISPVIATLTAQPVVSSIYATDRHFGLVAVGDSAMKTIEVRNTSQDVDLTITGLEITGSSAFTLLGSEYARFPLTRQPGGNNNSATTYIFVYKPTSAGKDTAVVKWLTDIPAPYETDDKNTSILTGEGTTLKSVGEPATTGAIRYINGKIELELKPGELLRSAMLTDLLGKSYDLDITLPIDLSIFPDGVYFVQLETDQRQLVQKLVK